LQNFSFSRALLNKNLDFVIIKEDNMVKKIGIVSILLMCFHIANIISAGVLDEKKAEYTSLQEMNYMGFNESEFKAILAPYFTHNHNGEDNLNDVKHLAQMSFVCPVEAVRGKDVIVVLEWVIHTII
jgi:hypothetical protein